MALLVLIGGPITMVAFTASPAFASGEQAVIGMPFAGKWAYSNNVNPPWTDGNSSHPSVHDNDGGTADWATDVYAAPATDVKLKVNYTNASLTYKVTGVSNTSCGAGKRVKVSLMQGSTEIGWVKYQHVDTSITVNTVLANGDSVGTTKNWGNLTCYQVSSDAGVHIHVAMKNSQSNHSCYVAHGNPGSSLAESADIGVIGSANTGTKQECTQVPTQTSSTTHQVSGSSVTFGNKLHVFGRGTNGEFYDNMWNGTSWSGFGDITPGSSFGGNPTAAQYNSELAVFGRGTNGEIYDVVWDGTAWSSVERFAPGATFTGDPVAIQYGTVISVFALGTNGRIYDDVWDGTAWSGFVDFAPSSTFEGNIALAEYGSVLAVYARGSNGEIYENVWGGSSWSGFHRLAVGAIFEGNPTATSFGGSLYVFARGTDDLIYVDTYNGSSWSGFNVLQAGAYFSGDAVVRQFGNSLGVFARGTNGQIYNAALENGSWSGFSNIGTGSAFVSNPSAEVYGTVLVVFARASNGEIYQNVWGTAWSGFSRLAPGAIFVGP